MKLSVGEAAASGFRRLVTPAGFGLFVAFAVVQYVALAATMTVFTGSLDVSLPYTLPLPGFAAALVALLGFIALSVVGVVATRTFANARDGFDAERATEDLARRTLTYLAAGVIVGLAIFVGTILLVVPGIYAAVSLLFVPVFVAVEDDGLRAAIDHSTSLASGHKWRLFGLLLVLAIALGVIGFVPDAFSAVTTGRIVAESVVNALDTTVSLGAAVNAYHQLRGRREDMLPWDDTGGRDTGTRSGQGSASVHDGR